MAGQGMAAARLDRPNSGTSRALGNERTFRKARASRVPSGTAGLRAADPAGVGPETGSPGIGVGDFRLPQP